MRTRVGYAGGSARNPTYRSMGDHTESIQIDFDPSKIAYAQLLDLFWACHNPCASAWSRQYMSAIWTHDDTQQRLALEAKAREEKQRGAIHTVIQPLTRFTIAEDYHQKYYLRQTSDVMREFEAIYPDQADFVASTAAARANGYIGGSGSAATLNAELASLGLSPEGQKRLQAAVGR